jgi:Zn-finger nucleic acid-binding protein
MARCPVCDSARIVVVLSPKPRAFCPKCGARWIQEGAIQRRVRAAASAPAEATLAASSEATIAPTPA